MNDSEVQKRRRWISFGELIAIAALIVSALGVWIAWKSSSDDKTTRVVEQRQAIPLMLRGKPDADGHELVISPVEQSHALDSLTVTINTSSIRIGSDGTLRAADVESALKERDKESKDVVHSIPARIDARYVEMGTDRRGGGNYVLRYRWEGGGLFGDRSLHLVSLSRG
jgi:hypothetical protein